MFETVYVLFKISVTNVMYLKCDVKKMLRYLFVINLTIN